MPAKLAVIAGLILLCVWPSAASDRVIFLPLRNEALAVSVGGNAFMVGGNYYSGGAFVWLPTTGDHAIGGTSLTKISRDGKTVIGDVLDVRGNENAGVWSADAHWKLLGPIRPNAQPCDALLTGAFGATDDGRVVVGLGWDGCSYAHAFRWSEVTGMVDLGTTNGRSTRANSVSNDGRVVVGWRTDETGLRQGAKWIDGKEYAIEAPRGGLIGEAHAANSDGTIIVGDNCDPSTIVGSSPAWIWRPETGTKCIPIEHPNWLPPLRFNAYRPFMRDLTDDGRLIVGSYSFGLDSEAMLWIDERPYFLKEYLAARGLPNAFDGWVNTGYLTSVSPDGRTLTGYGAGPRGFQGYVIILPEGAR